jgi:predicted nucleic-acid-binding Zn-ribbon protein
MSKAIECIRCHAQMEVGYMLDATHSGYQQQNWSSGEPKPSFWMGLKLAKDQVRPVTTFKCPRCGYLESYANTQSQDGVLPSGRNPKQWQMLAALMIALGLALLGVVFLIRVK